MLTDFFSLTPERVLEATERAGTRTTGLCYPLGSLENRVYELELEDRTRRVTKFYRPGRWSKAAILDEHRLLQALANNDIPVAAPLPFAHGETLSTTEEGIHFALFEKVGGRSPDELMDSELEQIGRLLARVHNVAATLALPHRPAISPDTYGVQALAVLLASSRMTPSAAPRLEDAAQRLIELCREPYAAARSLPLHGDCHRGNLLKGRNGYFLVDFDDMGHGPAVQDLWLLLPARLADCAPSLELMLRGYEQFRAFDRRELRLVEALRALRYLRYAAWIASRIEDPAFAHTFGNEFGTEVYWQRLSQDLYEQVGQLQQAA